MNTTIWFPPTNRHRRMSGKTWGGISAPLTIKLIGWRPADVRKTAILLIGEPKGGKSRDNA